MAALAAVVLAAEFNRMLERLAESVRDRTAFLAAVSHELRTPVTVARGYAETLERSSFEDAEGARATAAVIREELTQVGRLVDDLLALNRARLEDFVVPADVDLTRLFADLELRLAGLGLTDVEQLPAPDLTVRGDAARLQQAVLNLAANATVHTPVGTRVIMSAEAAGEDYVLAVSDDGPGMAPEFVDRVLQPGVKSSRPGGHDSSGLGLAVVDEVARAHGGQVRIETGETGTTVRLVLPTAGPPAEAEPAGHGRSGTGR